MSNTCIYIVIAAYNEAQSIRLVIESLLSLYPNIVVVDDGSTDGTSTILAEYPVIILRHILNRGQGAALQTGIEYALAHAADIIVTFDADGQHDVNDIAALVAPILAGECDITLGSRFLGQAHNIPWLRKFLLKAGILFTRIFSGIRITDVHNGIRAMSRKTASAIRIKMDRMGHASEILDQIARAGLRVREVPVNVYYTDYSLKKGQSSLHILKVATEILINKAGGR